MNREPRVMAPLAKPSEDDIQRLANQGIAIWRHRRNLYRPSAHPLPPARKSLLCSFFPSHLLDRVRYLLLHEQRVSLPQDDIRKFAFLPKSEHQHGFMFVDTLVLNEPATDRQWFHSLVHATQIHVLGLECYISRYMRALARTGAYMKVPFEIQAFCLDSRFAADPARGFSVEEEVTTWASQERY